VQERAYAEALKTAKTRPEDAGTIALGRRLAQLIDQERGEDGEAVIVVKLAAEYRAVLTALGMSPAARAAQTGKTSPTAAGDAPKSPLDQLRQRRAAKNAG
jgi:hypothetical protein